jgi:sporulation protein YabP
MVLEGRNSCRLQGVKDVLAFDTNHVVLETLEGMLTIAGSEMHVSRLTLDQGEIDVDGKVDSFVYTENSSFSQKGMGILARMFR